MGNKLSCYESVEVEYKHVVPSWANEREIDERDKNTKDEWIPRDARLIRNTGRHPLNCEPAHTDLVESGFTTPVSLHFVRNHGAVPKLTWEDHEISVHGMLEKPFKLDMHKLSQMKTITRSVTLTCCGNRRKELNALAKTQGFDFGPSATSTTYWTGVPLPTILQLAGVKPPYANKFVCFRGPEQELPQGSDGSYGTSMPLSHAMDPSNDVMLAYKQNGELLHPDHGYPVRMIVPGWYAGKMVKWLTDIQITDHESYNHYHLHDNKMLPSFVSDAEMAEKDGWWHKPEFTLNALNINSTISQPAHDEVIIPQQTEWYTFKGYAYSGSGNKITRVEISLDEGKTWQICDLHIQEEPNDYGKYWSWVFWSLDVKTEDLFEASEIICRAFDFTQNTQPAQLTWNLLGQGNNSMFRLHVNIDRTDEGTEILRFQQPAPVLSEEHENFGWLEEKAILQSDQSSSSDTSSETEEKPVQTFTMEEVKKHMDEKSAWITVDGKVYDCTKYLQDHPGGIDSILLSCGVDATEDFNAIHSQKAKNILKKFYIGDLVMPKSIATKYSFRVKSLSIKQLISLNPRKKISLPLIKKTVLNHSSFILRFALQTPKHQLGLPVGNHVYIYAQNNDKTIIREYTPISSDEDFGYIDLLIKSYPPNPPLYPLGGFMSQYLDNLKIGEKIDVKGPFGDFIYHGFGRYTYMHQEYDVKCINMIAGGTGITPMYQVIKAILKNSEDHTKISLIFANRTEEDILLRNELDQLAEKFSNFKLLHVLSKPPKNWGQERVRDYTSHPPLTERGHVDFTIMKKSQFQAGEGCIALLCGPQKMLDEACYPNLAKLGFKNEQIICF